MSESTINENETNDSMKIDFQILNLPVSDLVLNLPYKQKLEIFEYLKELDEHKRKSYLIAYDHLGTSFNIYKSNGYKEWKNSKK
jgi:phospholipid N-methyltransferase